MCRLGYYEKDNADLLSLLFIFGKSVTSVAAGVEVGFLDLRSGGGSFVWWRSSPWLVGRLIGRLLNNKRIRKQEKSSDLVEFWFFHFLKTEILTIAIYFVCTGVRSCYDEGKRTAETLAMDYHRGAGVEVGVIW